MARHQRQRLVVVGSGWVGLYLAQYIDTEKYHVSIISPNRTSPYTPLLASAAVALIPFRYAEESIRSKGRDVRFLEANVTGVDLEAKSLRCKAAFEGEDPLMKERAFEVEYDKLVLAPGCTTNTFGTPGVPENALFMKHVSDAMLLRQRLFEQLEKASLPCTSEQEKKDLLHIAIVGGGPTGVEITAELTDLTKREFPDLYPAVAHHLKITVYDVADHILGMYDQKLYQHATEKMVEKGIEIQTSAMIEKVERGYLHIKNKGKVPYGILLWVAGNKAGPLVEELDVKKSEGGLVRMLTDRHLRLQRNERNISASDGTIYPDVFALGDAADIESDPLPTTAEVAVQKSKYIVRQLNSASPAGEGDAFKFDEKKQVTYIGQKDGIIEGAKAGPQTMTGAQAWMSWRAESIAWTRTWQVRVGIVISTVMNSMFGRDINRL